MRGVSALRVLTALKSTLTLEGCLDRFARGLLTNSSLKDVVKEKIPSEQVRSERHSRSFSMQLHACQQSAVHRTAVGADKGLEEELRREGIGESHSEHGDRWHARNSRKTHTYLF